MILRPGVLPLLLALLLPAALPAQEESTLPEPKLLGPRTDQKEREAANKKYGGTEKTEAAVVAGLDWLARHAEEGGGWKADTYNSHCQGKKCEGIGGGHHGEAVPHPYNDAETAFCALAFLGHGVVPDPEGDDYQKLLDRALRTLQRPRSSWGMALALEALSEAEAMERKGRWKESVDSLADSLIQGREEDGAWAYAGGFRGGGDVPYTAFVVQGLVASRDAGAKLPEDMAKRVDAYLNSLEEHKGRLAYLKNGRSFGYTPTRTNAHSGAAIRELLDVGTDGPRHALHLGCVAADLPAWKIEWQTVPGYKEKFQVGNLNLYQWYYGTIASFHKGGGLWTSYFGAVKSALLSKQVKDGCAKGSWNNEGTYEIDVGGRVFTTSLAVLMLEQPYRHKKQGK